MTKIFSDLDQLGLTVGICNALRRGGIHTCAQLLHAGRAEVRKLRGIGPVAEMEIAKRLGVVRGIEWAEHGAPLPTLPPDAAQMVEALGLGDSPAIRHALARVLRLALELDELGHRFTASEVEHGTTVHPATTPQSCWPLLARAKRAPPRT